MKCLYYLLFSLLLFSCKDDNPVDENPIEQVAPLVVSSTKVTLSPKRSYAEIIIEKGAGNYRVSSSDETVAQTILIDTMLYIAGNNIGKATVTLSDQDNNQVKIKVTINELIARVVPLSAIVFVKIGDTKNISNTDTNPMFYLMDTASVVQVGGTADNVQITAKKKGVADLYYLKDYWPTIIYNIHAVEHYYFIVSPTTGSLRLAVGAESEYYILSGCGSYSLTISNPNVLSAELLAWPIEPTINDNNPRIVHIKALEKGTSDLIITNVETSEAKTVIVTVV